MAGPRRDHNREEFIELVTSAAEAMVRRDGLRGLGLRRLSAAVGYAPNSLYNAVGDLDAIILHVNGRTIERLRARLAEAVPERADVHAAALALADAYLDFVLSDPKLWSLLFEHVLPDNQPLPDWYAARLAAATALVDQVLVPLIADGRERGEAVAALWAALQGIASLATSGKLAAVTLANPRDLARRLVGGFLDGTAAQRGAPNRRARLNSADDGDKSGSGSGAVGTAR